MNRVFRKCFAFFLPVLVGLVLLGCSDDSVPVPINTTQGGISAVVNGAEWKSSDGNYKLGMQIIPNGAGAFVGTGDTLTIIGVQVQNTDTTAIVLSVKLNADKVGSYRIRSGTTGNGNAYFLNGFSSSALRTAKEKYDGGITNGELRTTEYDPANYKVSGDFGFSMSATGETTYTVIAGKIENVTF